MQFIPVASSPVGDPPRADAHKSPAMKVFEADCTFNYSWDEVSTGAWRKYCPWNDKVSHVIAVDTISRTVDPNTGIVRLSPPSVHSPKVVILTRDDSSAQNE